MADARAMQASPPARSEWRRRLRRLRRPAWLGLFRRTRPLSERWGSDRGTPLDRYYIERFLFAERAAIRGHVLEVKDASYTERFGSGVVTADVLDIDAANPHATLIADLVAGDTIPSGRYDCVILTQVLQLLFDVRAALAHVHRILRPGGVLLLTVPAVSRTVDTGDYWRFTPLACEALAAEAFPGGRLTVESHGNVFTGAAFLAGMAWEELSARELDHVDPRFPTLVTVRAVKA